VRALAKKFGLPNALRHDSQGLCFLGEISLETMLVREIPQEAGVVLSVTGERVGTHKGAAHYTLGQRHGFELYAHEPHTVPHFVVGKNMETNTITVSIERFPQTMCKTKLALEDTNWIGSSEDGACEARFRYRQKLIPAQVKRVGGVAEVLLEEPHFVPEGQSLVLYQGERCLGGGVIENATLVS
jgi:tRNA-specific 2-thiouridylase